MNNYFKGDGYDFGRIFWPMVGMCMFFMIGIMMIHGWDRQQDDIASSGRIEACALKATQDPFYEYSEENYAAIREQCRRER